MASVDSYLKKEMQNLPCPMVWKPETVALHYVDDTYKLKEQISTLIEKRNCYVTTDFHWRKYIVNLVLGYTYYRLKEPIKALKTLTICEDATAALKVSWDQFYVKTAKALRCVISACRCFVYFEMPNFACKATAELTANMDNYKAFRNTTVFQSVVLAIHGAILMEYGLNGTTAAIPFIQDAITLDTTFGEWYFLKGKCFSRLRRVFQFLQPASKEELDALNTAILSADKESCPLYPYYLVYLAQSQRETAFRLTKYDQDERQIITAEIDALYISVVKNYHLALYLRPLCIHINVRSALGFMKMPSPYRDANFALECIGTSLKLNSDNRMAHHVAGLIEERLEKNPKAALLHYGIAAKKMVFGAWMNSIRLAADEFKKAYNPIKDLEQMLTIFHESHQQDEIRCQMGSYHVFQKRYMFDALNYLMPLVEQNPNATVLRMHRSIFLPLRYPIDLIDIIIKESKWKIKDKRTKQYQLDRYRRAILKCVPLSETYMRGPCNIVSYLSRESFLLKHPWNIGRAFKNRKSAGNLQAALSTAGSSHNSKQDLRTVTEPIDIISVSETKKGHPRKKKNQLKNATVQSKKVLTPSTTSCLIGWISEEEQLNNEKRRKSKAKWKQSSSAPNGSTLLHKQYPEVKGRSDNDKDWRSHSVVNETQPMLESSNSKTKTMPIIITQSNVNWRLGRKPLAAEDKRNENLGFHGVKSHCSLYQNRMGHDNGVRREAASCSGSFTRQSRNNWRDPDFDNRTETSCSSWSSQSQNSSRLGSVFSNMKNSDSFLSLNSLQVCVDREKRVNKWIECSSGKGQERPMRGQSTSKTVWDDSKLGEPVKKPAHGCSSSEHENDTRLIYRNSRPYQAHKSTKPTI